MRPSTKKKKETTAASGVALKGKAAVMVLPQREIARLRSDDLDKLRYVDAVLASIEDARSRLARMHPGRRTLRKEKNPR
jgi:hypothetical protein